MTLNERVALMRRDSKLVPEDLEEYKRTEILRKSMNDVKTRARDEEGRRKSPVKTYSSVKSKIAGNLKSQKKAKKVSAMVEEQKALDREVRAGNLDVLEGRTFVTTNTTSSPKKRAQPSP